jgi:N-carbamoylputrescine amidase
MPESARALAIAGAEIIFNPSATGNFARSWNTRLLQTRAYENKSFIVSVNMAWPRINGRSIAISPTGKILKRCGFRETVQIISLDLFQARKNRKHLNTRRPSVYSNLVQPTQSLNVEL